MMRREARGRHEEPKMNPESAWGNPFVPPGILELEPHVAVAERYSVRTPSGARYTVCAPAAAADTAPIVPRPHYSEQTRMSRWKRGED
jgi:hypothetical protein